MTSAISHHPPPNDGDIGEAPEDHLRSPLTAIRAAAEILRDYSDLSRSEQLAFTEAVLVESARLDALIGRLLACRSRAC